MAHFDVRNPSALRLHLAIHRLVRRALIAQATPAEIEARFAERAYGEEYPGMLSRCFRELAKRALGRSVRIHEADPHELRLVAISIAREIDDEDWRHPWYPDGWRDSLIYVRGQEAANKRPELEAPT